MTTALTIAEILDQPALVPLWPTVGRALGLAESTTYQLAAQDRLGIEVIRLGRRRFARTVDLHHFLGLLPETHENDGAGSSHPTPPDENALTNQH
ncbi:DNA-binding protein [Streptomyces sp. NPDC020607]|uniref:DNA-binding protein n=1 Tax=Streptomyces sp. NPDC020607 TaxID=3365082 RepID=UPI00379B942C